MTVTFSGVNGSCIESVAIVIYIYIYLGGGGLTHLYQVTVWMQYKWCPKLLITWWHTYKKFFALKEDVGLIIAKVQELSN